MLIGARVIRRWPVESPMSTHTYSSYLEIDKLLSAQRSMTDSDDELLFIVIHQAHELWFKLAIHELGCAIEALHRERPSNSDCIIAFKRLSRVSEIQRILIASWGVLTTLTPDEFHVFRLTVGQNGASGFQSIQYRVLEFKLGLKYRIVRFDKPVDGGYQTVELDVFGNAQTDADKQALEDALNRPSIYDAVIYYISKHLRMSGTPCSARPNSTCRAPDISFSGRLVTHQPCRERGHHQGQPEKHHIDADQKADRPAGRARPALPDQPGEEQVDDAAEQDPAPA